MLLQSFPWLLLAALLTSCVFATAWPLFGRKRSTLLDPPEEDLAPPEPEEEPVDEAPPVDERALDQLMQQVVHLNEQLAGFDAKRLVLVENNAQLTIQLKGRTTELYHARAELGARKEELSRALARQHELETMHLHQQQKLEESAEQQRALEARLAGHTQELEVAARRLSEVERDLSAQLVELDGRVAAGEDALAEKLRQLADAEQRCQELEAQALQQESQRNQRADAEEEARAKMLREIEASSARIRELEDELVRGDDGRRERAAAFETLQSQLAEQTGRCDVLERRCEGLELELQQRTERQQDTHEAVRVRERELGGRIGALEHELRRRTEQEQLAESRAKAREQELADRIAQLEAEAARGAEQHAARLAELDAQAARREEQQCLQATTLEALRGELEDACNRASEATRRNGELAESLRQQTQQQRDAEERAGEREQALRARIAELEADALQHVEELAKRSATLEAVLGALTEKTARCDELTRVGAECEAELATRSGEAQELRSERAQLIEQRDALARSLTARERDLEQHERDLSAAGARIDVLSHAVERASDELCAELAPIEELVEGRISALFDPRSGQTPEELVRSYLQGLEQRDLDLAVRGLFGGAEPLSAAAMARLAARWTGEHQAWRSQAIEGEVVYLWADGSRVRAGLEADDASLLVIVAGFVDGSRRVVTVESGPRESADAWLLALQGLVQRGMKLPRLVVAEDGLGIWPALATLGWDCAQQCSWDQRIEHVLDALPKRQRRRAAELMRGIAKAQTRAAAQRLRDAFVRRYRARRPDAVQRLQADWERMTGIYSFPADHWPHLRNAAVIGSLLDSMRLRTSLSKPAAHTPNAEAILWKFLLAGAKSLRKLNSPQLLPAVAAAEPCVDGVLRQAASAARVARRASKKKPKRPKKTRRR